MIIHSPESTAPEPYRSYVHQRNQTIAQHLEPVVGQTDVQLCPRAITVDEAYFDHPDSIVYGAVVRNLADGLKSTLYTLPGIVNPGIATTNLAEALAYAQTEFAAGNRVRVKDPEASDSQGQYTAETASGVAAAFNAITDSHDYGAVIMPHLAEIQHRLSVWRHSTRQVGHFRLCGS